MLSNVSEAERNAESTSHLEVGARNEVRRAEIGSGRKRKKERKRVGRWSSPSSNRREQKSKGKGGKEQQAAGIYLAQYPREVIITGRLMRIFRGARRNFIYLRRRLDYHLVDESRDFNHENVAHYVTRLSRLFVRCQSSSVSILISIIISILFQLYQ